MKTRKYYTLLAIILVIIPFCNRNFELFNDSESFYENYPKISSPSNIELTWNKTYGYSTSDEYTSELCIDSSDNIYIAGSSVSLSTDDEMYFQKYDRTGKKISGKTWGRGLYPGRDEKCYALGVDSSESVYLAGEMTSQSDTDAYLVKFVKDDIFYWKEWERSWGDISLDSCTALTLDSSDNIYVTGFSQDDLFLRKYNNGGTLQWALTGSDSFDLRPQEICLDSSQNIYIAGYCYIPEAGPPTIVDTFLLKFNNNGVNIWSQFWGVGNGLIDVALDMKISFNNDIYVSGYQETNGQCDFLIIKYDNEGIQEWYKVFGGSGNEISRGITLDSMSNIYIAGDIEDLVSNQKDMYLIKLNEHGEYLWNKTWGGNADEIGIDIELDSSENVNILGHTKSYGSGGYDAYLINYNRIPQFEINSPNENQEFGSIPPTFDLNTNDTDIVSCWYSLNNGENYTFTGTNGEISKTAWDLYNSGDISITFYMQDYTGYITSVAVTVQKSFNFTVQSPIENNFYSNVPPEFNLTINDSDLNTSWYTINNGRKYFILDTTGIIDESDWISLNDGSVTITFYMNNTDGHQYNQEVDVIKNSTILELRINSPILNDVFHKIPPYYDIDLSISDINYSWYVLTDSQNNSYSQHFSGTNGTIDSYTWNLLKDGETILEFHVNNSEGTIVSDETHILKDRNLAFKNVYAIVIGIEDYPGTDYDLNFCQDDASSIKGILQSEYNVKPTNIKFLLNSLATKSRIDSRFSEIRSQITKNDVFFFYFSGHGGSTGGVQFLCPWDSIPSNPSNYFSDSHLANQLNSLECAEKYVVIDSCNSGGMISETKKSGRFIMTACNTLEDSWESSGLRHGVFTFYFLKSHEQASDTDGNGVLSMEELFSYAKSRTTLYESTQNPQNYDGISGPAILYSAFSSVMLNIDGNKLDYSFFLHGTGTVNVLNLTVCSVSENIVVKNTNLLNGAVSDIGFAFYSGQIQLNNGYNITGYELLASIKGYQTLTKTRIFGDYDGDGVHDINEIKNGMNPRINDTDFDGLSDYEEYYGDTNPILNDTEGDGMLDGYEVFNGLDPLTNDTLLDLDGDGLINIVEYNLGTYPNNADTDGDSMDDGYEFEFGLDLFSNDASLDLDGDGLTNGIECLCGSMANNSDSDSDNMPDSWEYDNELEIMLNDANEDPDDDGLDNVAEYQNGTNPHIADTDGDTWNDGDEVIQGTDPLNPDDYPVLPSSPNAISGYQLFPIISLLLICSIVLGKRLKLNRNKS